MEMMRKMRFGWRWRRWIHAFNSTSISILVNGFPTNEFSIERGVRQGDPLSPFLFIIAAEGLNYLTKKAVREDLFKGVEIGANKVPISQLQYTNRQNFCNLMKILKCFENVSGLKINFHKSQFYGLGVSNVEVERMASRVDCKVGEFPFTYFGLPIGRNMNKAENWDPVVEKFNTKLAHWRTKMISYGGWLTLVKSVLSNLPSGERSKLIWVMWDDTLVTYDEGGLSIGSLKGKNLALLGKWFWRAKTEPHSLWVKLIKSIHGPNGLLPLSGSPNPQGKSDVWLNVLRAGNLIGKTGPNFANSFAKIIGDGTSTQFWNDTWLFDEPLREKFKRLFKLEGEPEVAVCERSSNTGVIVGSAIDACMLLVLLVFIGCMLYVRKEELKEPPNRANHLVYKGSLPKWQMIDIKRAQQGSTQGKPEFTEIELLSKFITRTL
ncbi:uncharacterized protein [Rutidosis leptorrhynchoides]|uniref:uncharacterized protein n=1 Tax=Rutidosis leptorrhynchoides TaxID=125765 RepID=UPI003A999E94